MRFNKMLAPPPCCSPCAASADTSSIHRQLRGRLPDRRQQQRVDRASCLYVEQQQHHQIRQWVAYHITEDTPASGKTRNWKPTRRSIRRIPRARRLHRRQCGVEGRSWAPLLAGVSGLGTNITPQSPI